MVVLYTIYILYALCCTIEYVILYEILGSYPKVPFAIAIVIDSETIVGSSPYIEQNYNVYLSSIGPDGSTTNTTGGDVPVQGIKSTYETDTNNPSPQIPVQSVVGDEIKPGIFTTAKDPQSMNSYNTYNANNGQVDHCEFTDKNHL